MKNKKTKSKSIGLLTLVASDNCGSLLQCFALQELLVQRNLNVEVIDFKPKCSKDLYRLIPKWVYKHPTTLFRYLLNIRKLIIQKRGYSSFRKKYIKLSKKRYTNTKSLENSNYWCYVVGSDQVWNHKMPDFDPAYLLEWVPSERKFSYAASFGNADASLYLSSKTTLSLFSNFRLLSVREIENMHLLSTLLNRPVYYSIDPTLLIDKDVWCSLAGDRLIKSKYIFYYSWSYNNQKLRSIVESFSKKVGLPVYVINASKWVKNHIRNKNFKLYKKSGPSVFLNLMKFADYVFVESFHGIIFSNIFGKDFYYLEDNKKGEMDKRIKNIIDLTKSSERVIRSFEDIKDQNLITREVEIKKTNEYSDSVSYLSILENEIKKIIS